MKIQPRSILEAKIREIIDDQTYNAYICGRDWSAWQAGTMTRDDFTKLSDSPRFEELVRDIMDAACGPQSSENAGRVATADGNQSNQTERNDT